VCSSFSSVAGNVNLVAHRILEKLPPDDRWGEALFLRKACFCSLQTFFLTLWLTCSTHSRLSFSQERFLFHVLVVDGITFLCCADEVSLSLAIECQLCFGARAWQLPISGDRQTRSGPLAGTHCYHHPGLWPAHPLRFFGRSERPFLENLWACGANGGGV
jgi:hypothetical protein